MNMKPWMASVLCRLVIAVFVILYSLSDGLEKANVECGSLGNMLNPHTHHTPHSPLPDFSGDGDVHVRGNCVQTYGRSWRPAHASVILDIAWLYSAYWTGRETAPCDRMRWSQGIPCHVAAKAPTSGRNPDIATFLYAGNAFPAFTFRERTLFAGKELQELP